MENKYYTPDLEDLRTGYRCQVKYPNGWYDWNISSVSELEDLKILIKTNEFRTKYLDKEDIESLEFKYVDEARLDERGDYIRFSKEWSECPPDARCNDHYYGTYWICLNNREGCISFEGRCKPKLIIYKERHGGFVGGQEDFILFDGDCPSINELKYLMKLLNIK